MTTGVEVIRARINPFYLSSDNILAGEVDTYADLPTYANVGDVFLVKTTTGIIGNRKLAGLYVWDGLVWNPVPTAMTATNIYYDNTASGLSANNTQLAIDELKTGSKHIVSASFNASDGVLTLLLNDTSTITVDLDGRYMESVVEDTTPQLGGNLDLNGSDIIGTGNISIDGEIEANLHIGPLRGEICFNAKAGEALTKGDPVYISNFDTVGNKPVVGKADADDANKMPSFGLAKETVSINASVTVVTFGTLDGIDTSSFNLGDILYISTTGTLTNQPPTGETSLIQNMGKVMRSHATNGSIKVGGAGRSNDTPNLNDGNVFIGNASNQAEARQLQSDDINFDGLNVGFSGTITNNRIKVGDTSFYIDLGNSNLPLIGWDPNDYIAYNRTDNKLSTVIGGSEITKTDSDGIKLRGDKAIVIGDDASDTPATTPPAQLYLGGTHNAGYNISTKFFIDGYDNEAVREVMKFRDENDNIDLLLESGVNYPTLTMRGKTVFNEADRTTYGVDLNTMKTAGIYMIGTSSTNLPPQRDTGESSWVMTIYTYGTQNGVQILYSTDYDSPTTHNAMYSRVWESSFWTDWNCVSSTPETLCDLNVSIGSSYTNFSVAETLSTITTRYKQLMIMFDSSIHDGSLMFHAPFLAVNETFEYGKYSTRYVNFKTPTSTSSTTWQAYGGGVTVTRIRMIGYR